MKDAKPKQDSQWKALTRNDWADILALSEKKTYQTKFEIIEAFTQLVAEHGFHQVSHLMIAKRCGIKRQVVDYHFPEDALLVSLAFRYIYARLQKLSTDSILSREGFRTKLKAYIELTADWTQTHRSDARFLVSFYGLLQSHPQIYELHERNLSIGQERIATLCMTAKKEKLFQSLSEEELKSRASSIQKLLMGFVIVNSAREHSPGFEDEKKELWRSTLALLGLSE